MANWIKLTLDTTGPANPLITMQSGAVYTTAQLVDVAISCSDEFTTGYQMKLWGSVDKAHDPNVQDTEVASQWITYNTAKQIMLAASDGAKQLFGKIRDDLKNESSIASDTINLDMTLPASDMTAGDVTRISLQDGSNTCTFSFTCSEDFVEYEVRVVPNIASGHDTGSLIPITGGSVNMSGTGTFPAGTPITCSVKGIDFKAASSNDGEKVIKAFTKDLSGQWSV